MIENVNKTKQQTSLQFIFLKEEINRYGAIKKSHLRHDYISAQKVVINNVGNMRSLTFFKKLVFELFESKSQYICAYLDL